MVRPFLAILLLMTLFALEMASVQAQTESLSVYFGGGPNIRSTTGAPGSTVAIPVLVIGITGTVPSEGVEITVPKPLRVLGTSTCIAETVAARANAAITIRPCQIVGWNGPDGAQIISAEIEDLASLTGFRIEATLRIEIPADTPVGSMHTLSAPNKNFAAYAPLSEFTIEVVSNSEVVKPAAPTAIPTVRVEEPLYDIDGSVLEFPMGSIKLFSFEISYDAFPEATSASLVLFADTGHIDVSDPSVIDHQAPYACYEDPSTDYNSRAPKRSIAVLPTIFNLTLGRWIEPGSEIRVCAEVVYYNGTTVLGVERHRSVITVRE